MPEEPNFLDLVCVLNITGDTTIERFGSLINASTFDGANIAGTLKQKGLIDFTSFYPGPNTMKITDQAKALISEADTKATTPFDPLDESILVQISGGKKLPSEVQSSLNIRPKDLALHLYKVSKQGLITYELKTGNVSLALTEQGFIKANENRAAPKPAPQPQQAAAKMPPQPQAATMAQQTAPQMGAQANASPEANEPQMAAPKGSHTRIIIVVVVVIVLIILGLTEWLGIWHL